MTDDLVLLREEVREAIDDSFANADYPRVMSKLRAGLLRLARENAETSKHANRMFLDAREWATRFGAMEARAERAESERDALRKRIDGSATCYVKLWHGDPYMYVENLVCNDAALMDKWTFVALVPLVPLDDAEAKG